MSRYPGLTLRVLARRGAAMGPGKAELIERIAETGSISAAARAMRMSYCRARQLVESLKRDFCEPVITTAIGGRRGGGARVTRFGRGMLAPYPALEAKNSGANARELPQVSPRLG